MRAILANPRYTGHQVWNRQHIEYRRTDGGSVRVQRWNPSNEWVSSRPAHPSLISEGDFVAAQAIRAVRATRDGPSRTYRLAGLLQCGICGRRLDAHWVNNRPGYRCRHGHSSAHPTAHGRDHERAVCLREDELLHDLASTLHRGNERPPEPKEIPALLRAIDITVVCSHTRRALVLTHPGPPSPMG